MKIAAMLPLWGQIMDWWDEKMAERRIRQSRREYERQCAIMDARQTAAQFKPAPPKVIPQQRAQSSSTDAASSAHI